MSLPQIKACLRGSERRDAKLALQNLDSVHGAVAPLLCGKEGSSVLDKVITMFKRVISPRRTEREIAERQSAMMRARVAQSEGKNTQ